MPENIKNYKIALIGLIIFFAFSLVIAGGGKPKINNIEPTLKRLSGNEIKALVAPIPTDALTPPMVKYSGLDKDMSREEIINGLRLSRINDIPFLERFFPNVHFLKGIDWGIQSEIIPVYLIAIFGNKLIDMPTSFNRLLVESGLEINDKNIIELAKAFVILALGSETVMRIDGTWDEELALFPQITFLEEKRSVDKKKDPPIYRVHLKVKVNNQKQIYGFHIKKGQFQWVTMDIEGGTTTKWFDLDVIEDTLKRGELDLEGQIKISTTSPSKAYLEPGDIYHYYLIVDTNGFTSK